MKWNRERAACALSLLILVFGIYGMATSSIFTPPPPIETTIPPSTLETPRLEPRLYTEEAGGSRNPFDLASDWRPITPQDLPAPPCEPTRFLLLAPAMGPDSVQVGYAFLKEPPVELKSDEPGEGAGQGAEKAAGEGASPQAGATAPAVPPATVPPPAGTAAQPAAPQPPPVGGAKP